MYELFNAYWDFLNKFSPYLLLGFIIAGLLHGFVNDRFIQKNFSVLSLYWDIFFSNSSIDLNNFLLLANRYFSFFVPILNLQKKGRKRCSFIFLKTLCVLLYAIKKFINI